MIFIFFLPLLPLAYYLIVASFLGIYHKVYSCNDMPTLISQANSKCLLVVPLLNCSSLLPKKVHNIIDFLTPEDYSVLFIDDGSTDNTLPEIVRLKSTLQDVGFETYVKSNPRNIGRSLTHNSVLKEFNYDYFFFSDVDTSFTSTFPKNGLQILRTNPSIGAVSCKVKFIHNTIYGLIFSKLFDFDILIRHLSNIAGICMKPSGPSIIIKSYIWDDLEKYEDIDHAVGFMCLRSFKKLSFLSTSIVIDLANSTKKKDFLARTRMTRKSLLSLKKQLINGFPLSPFNLLAVIGYILHKPLRFFTFPLIFALINFSLVSTFGAISYQYFLFLMAICFVPIFNHFAVFSISYAYGIFLFLKNDQTSTYKPVNS